MGNLGERGGAVELVSLRRYPDALIPAGGRDHWRDWYGIRGIPTGHLREVPGVTQLVDGSRIYHRSHLPLVNEEVAQQAKLLRVMDWAIDGGLADGTVLRAHQIFGACWIRQRSGTLLADGMRVGKTGQVIAAHNPETGPLVVCAPLNTRRVWLKWMAKRWPSITPCVVEGLTPSPAMKSSPLVFVHPELLGAHQILGDWHPGTLAIDEVHKFSNPKSIRTQGARLLATNAYRVVGMTGTPLWNEPTGLYPILAMISPAAWGAWKEFATRYCGGRPGPWGMVAVEATHVDELQLRLTEVLLRRQWGEVGLTAPPTDRRIVTVPVPTALAHEIDKAVEGLRTAGKKRVPAAELAILRRVVAKTKAQKAIDLSIQIGREHHVIWTWHRELAKIIASEARGVVVTGETPATRREQIFDWWEENGGPLVLTMSVGEVGIDLSAAKVAIFAELDWTPATLAQAEMRTFSPARSMTVMYIAADHRVDHEIVRALGKKLDLAKVLGIPAADGAIDVIGRAFDLDVGQADLAALARELTTGRVQA